jgi:hypothetical protein
VEKSAEGTVMLREGVNPYVYLQAVFSPTKEQVTQPEMPTELTGSVAALDSMLVVIANLARCMEELIGRFRCWQFK